MEKVKKQIQEFQELMEDQTEEEESLIEKNVYENLKPEINSLLVQYLPAHIKVGDLEILACTIFDVILSPDKYLK